MTKRRTAPIPPAGRPAEPQKPRILEENLKVGYVRDYISGRPVLVSPEEMQAVQVFARRLVEDYGYPKEQISTRPQHRVRARPSDGAKSYPVDIAVFRSATRTDDELFMIVECKQRQRKDGVEQLKLYMDMSSAEVGVWFNGDEHEYLRKVYHNGGRSYQALPNFPRCGQRIEDVGLYKRRDLVRPSNLKAVFRDIRNHLAGMTTGITRDEALAQEIINVLFCKILDERETELDDAVRFRAGVTEPASDVRERILTLFEKVKTATFEDVVGPSDAITLDEDSLVYVVGELQTYCIMDADRDAIGDAFEVFIGPALRGAEGQFFTPRNVVRMVVDMINPRPGEKIIDPACGSGGFLISSLEHVWGQVRAEARRKEWNEEQRLKRQTEVAAQCFRGIDKDAFLAKVCKAYMALIGDGRGGVFCANSLTPPKEWPAVIQEKVKLGQFHVVMTNPPFGQKIVVKGAPILSQFDMGFKWKLDKKTHRWARTHILHQEQPPHLLFLDRCLQLLRDGGRLGIVLPESVLGNPSYGHVVSWLMERTTIRAIVTMPESLFKTSGKSGTHTKVCVLVLVKDMPTESYPIFMAEAKWCGHDSRGNPTTQKTGTGGLVVLDDTPVIGERFKRFTAGEPFARERFGFVINSNELRKRILVPKYYNPEIDAQLARLGATHDLVTVGSLAANETIAIETGVEVGKMAYGTGTIPFIRTSDISNWEIKSDFKHGISEELYLAERSGAKKKTDVAPGDILIVRDGTYLIGVSAIVTASDLPMLYQSHIQRIRVLKKEDINPWLLFACLNSPIVRRQIKAKQFTQDIIDTLGGRLMEVVLPIPKDRNFREKIARETETVILTRIELRNRAKQISLEVEGIANPAEDDRDVLRNL